MGAESGQSLDGVWTKSGRSLDKVWTESGQSLDRIWTVSQKSVFKFSTSKLKTQVENSKVGFDFSFKFSTFGTISTNGFQVFNFKVEN